jgi:glycosyltransferase involved in cell wall biosynthesis
VRADEVRVLWLIKGLGRGGAEQLLVSSLASLDRDRIAVEVAYLVAEKDALVEEFAAADVPVHCLGTDAGWPLRLRALVQQHRIDIVHTHAPYAAAFARPILAGTGTAVVHTEHGPWDRYRRGTYWANLLTYGANRYAFAVSDYVRDSIERPKALRWLRMPPVETLYHGLDTTATRATTAEVGDLRTSLGIAPDAPLIGTVANFRAQKRYDVLLRAATRVAASRPEVRFLLVGDGPLLDEMQSLAAELRLNATVIFAGRRDDALAVMQCLDVFVLASAYEGLPIALVEAMTLHRPVVVTRVGGISELVREEDGLMVDVDDPAALAAAIERLIDDPELRADYAERAAKRADAFDLRHAVERQQRLYLKLYELGG